MIDPELQLCYDRESFKRVRGIRMIFHFQDADITLNKVNLFIDAGYNLSCLAMLPSTDIYIYGNRAQINFQVEYDRSTSLYIKCSNTGLFNREASGKCHARLKNCRNIVFTDYQCLCFW